ncbi:hypothetical protein CVT26_004075 [Gymnopilus dilepis]|uniref:Ricin B lectin domain-containing protein n=1 Tax=Gymnopilus dilepis TaxID=231916 RepID=A0A409YMN5_9AGAR|nr:hypothetical protein CVT26_004075 [Gymnopilus dilepis]
MASLFLLALTSLQIFAVAGRTFNVLNLCPQSISVYINGENNASLSSSQAINLTLEDTWSGLIYTTANGGSESGKGSVKAGFIGAANYYYIVKDENMNTGLSINPNVPSTDEFLEDGFCGMDICDSTYCPSPYSSPPTSVPAQGTIPPTRPLFSCPSKNSGYTVTFCPEKTFPPSGGTTYEGPCTQMGLWYKCATIISSSTGICSYNYIPFHRYDCNDTSAQRWTLSPGNETTSIRLAGTDFCLDAGIVPSNGSKLKIWQCFEDLPAQTWNTTEASTVRLSNFGKADFCLDNRNGTPANGNPVQTWRCGSSNGNPSQLWSTSNI